MVERSNYTLSQEPSTSGSPSGYGGVAVLVLLVLLALGISCGSSDQSRSLDDYVHKQVGDFTLQEKHKLQEKIDAGADKAFVMTYVARDRTELTHYLFDFPSPEKANLTLQAQVQNSKAEGFEQVGGGNIKDPEGSKIGAWAEMKKGDTLVMHWTNNKLYAVIAGPKGYIDRFYAAASNYY